MEIKSHSNSTKLWTKNYIFMLFANLFIYLAFYMLTPTLPAYAKLCGGSSLEASLVVSTFSITSLLVRLFIGNIMDKIEVKPLLFLGGIILGASTLSYNYLPLDAIIVVRVIQGIGWGLASTGAAAIFSNIVPKEKRGEGMGYYSLSMIVSMALSPLIAIEIMNLSSFKNIVFISIALVIIGVLFLSQVNLPKKTSVKSNLSKKFSLADAFEKQAALPSLLCFLLVITLCGIMSYIMLYGKEINISSIGIYFIGFVAMILITRPFVGKIFDEKGHAVIIIPSAISLIIGLIILSYANSTLMLVVSSLFYGLGYGAAQPSLQAWAVNRSPSNRQGAANGTFLSSMDLSYTFGSILLSFIAEHKSYAIMYRFSSIFIVLLLVVYSYNIFVANANESEALEEEIS
ncbi:MFS transporter [Clostridium saccharobutylicum]|uniref:MFS-type transporter YwoG n=1 Tax=Clostridium saccharobutylicum DSM 13864 TaxID=1345695 RepID=U5MYY1_CLOSA|nr:MFS transporter [Clostridium saccharobutylicum]AGX44712.1 MFS-type transporter YwoG [Clostridium saccharobutylicum DSM 13864]AQR92001.1 bacillibactin exporter [Clostridium saccharobutylicum]AQS01903.1 bacillibactin exporter [Clostridium saccharobutylicum]AQS11503.1 bacillibactin exporter [Clostridium saccharobutylicum]AQS15886.1 bacillibactin exporter [Clostridium saccharobutylicum]